MSWRTPHALRSVSHGHHRPARLRRASRCARRAARREGPGGPRPSPAGPASRRFVAPDGVRRPGGLTAAHRSPATNSRRRDDAARAKPAEPCRARAVRRWTQPDGSTYPSGEIADRSPPRPVGSGNQARSHFVVAPDAEPPPGKRTLTQSRSPPVHDRDRRPGTGPRPYATRPSRVPDPARDLQRNDPAHSGTPWCGVHV